MANPIVIIHGWSDSSESFKPLADYIRSISGAPPVEINLADYVSMDDEVRFDDIVEAMKKAWNRFGLSTAPGSVDAVVHSTGGLVIRDWLTTFPAGAAPIKRLLMLAPANFGSPLAHKGRAFYGRVVKGFGSEKRFQTGTRILKGLELASPYAWRLAMRDRFGDRNHFGKGQVLCTVLVGNVGYDGIMAAANEDGSDGTVRVSTANLNCVRISADFSTNPKLPTYQLEPSAGTTAFRIIDDANHSTVAMKNGGPKKAGDLKASIKAALTQDDDSFDDWCGKCTEHNAEIVTKAEADENEEKYGYQNTVVRLSDDAGHPVTDYFMEFYRSDADDKANIFARMFHRDIIRAVHAHADDASYRSLMIDCTSLSQSMQKKPKPMFISLSAMPDFRENGLVGYLTFSEKDIGGIELSPEQMTKVFQPHRTVLIDIRIRRERAARVFELKKG